MTWLILQGDTLETVQAEDAPDLTVKPGERRKMIVGGSRDPEKFAQIKARYEARSRGVAGKGEAR